jgi:transposase-like protein
MTTRRQKRSFSAEFKKEIVKKILSGEATVTELAEQHDLTVTMICRWKRQMREDELDMAVEKAPRVERAGVDPRYVRHLEEKLKTANEKLGELYIVVEGLKKVREDLARTKNASSLVVTGTTLDPLRRRVG